MAPLTSAWASVVACLCTMDTDAHGTRSQRLSVVRRMAFTSQDILEDPQDDTLRHPQDRGMPGLSMEARKGL